MEVDITQFVTDCDAFQFSASKMEMGDDAGRITWRNAVREGTESPLLTTPKQIEALLQWATETGAWDAAERAAWSDAECNALFIQLISGDMREAGMDDCFIDEFDWDQYQVDAEAGRISGNIFRGDDGSVYYYLGN